MLGSNDGSIHPQQYLKCHQRQTSGALRARGPFMIPLVCGDCSAVLCRVCGTPLESADELAFG